MYVLVQKWPCYFHNNVVDKALKMSLINFLPEVNSKVGHVAIFGIGGHPNFYAVFR